MENVKNVYNYGYKRNSKKKQYTHQYTTQLTFRSYHELGQTFKRFRMLFKLIFIDFLWLSLSKMSYLDLTWPNQTVFPSNTF